MFVEAGNKMVTQRGDGGREGVGVCRGVGGEIVTRLNFISGKLKIYDMMIDHYLIDSRVPIKNIKRAGAKD